MTTWILTGVVLLVVIGAVVLVVFNKPLAAKETAARDRVREVLGGEPTRLATRVTGMGSAPMEVPGLRGMGVLGVSGETVAFSTWTGETVWQVERSAVAEVGTDVDDVVDVGKAIVWLRLDDSSDTQVRFRVPDPADWLDALGFDWGAGGRPEARTDDDED